MRSGFLRLLFVSSSVIMLRIIPSFAVNHSERLIPSMNNREKIGQMILVYNSPYAFLDSHNIGAVLIMQSMLKKPELLKKEIADAQAQMKIPLLVAIDQEGGSVNRLGSLPRWKHLPSAQAMAQLSDDSIVANQKYVAQFLGSLGINFNLAPVLDPAENYAGVQTYIDKKRRSYGTNSEEIVPPAGAFISAFSANSIGSVAKHFPGYDVAENSDYAIAVSMADSQQLSRYTIPFQALSNRYCGIMMSSVRYEHFCETPAVFCPKIVSIARKISPDGIIMTDDLWGVSLRSFTYPGHEIDPVRYPDSAFIRIVEQTVKAGNDMLMITYPQKVPLMITTIEQMMERDSAVHAHVNAAVRRIIMVKERLGLFGDNPDL